LKCPLGVHPAKSLARRGRSRLPPHVDRKLKRRRRKAPLCEPPHRQKPLAMAGSQASAIDSARWTMQMHQIRYFLALCEERNFTRAARRCGVSQPSLTNAIIGLERELGGALFHRRPLPAPPAMGPAIPPSRAGIPQTRARARGPARALAVLPPANSEPAPHEELAGSPLCPSS